MTTFAERLILTSPTIKMWDEGVSVEDFMPLTGRLNEADALNQDELWEFAPHGELVPGPEATQQASLEIVDQIIENAITEANQKISMAKEMMPNLRAVTMARLVAEQCLGIKPVFGKRSE
jgi:hypothetical protein